MEIKTILYDLDGVLVDACDWHYEAFNMALLSAAGCQILRAEHESTFNGLPTKQKLDILESQGRIKRDDFEKIWKLKQEFTLEVIKKNVTMDHEKIKLHTTTREMGIVSACVTNSISESAHLMLEGTGQLQFMDFVIGSDNVKNPKPSSEPYVRAMIRLSSPPDETLIVEDSDKGFAAAIGTGSTVMRVQNAVQVTLENIMTILTREASGT